MQSAVKWCSLLLEMSRMPFGQVRPARRLESGTGTMKIFTTFASAAVLAVTLAAAAAPAQAAVFAQWTPDTNAADYKWVNNGLLDTGTGAHLFSITNLAHTTPNA